MSSPDADLRQPRCSRRDDGSARFGEGLRCVLGTPRAMPRAVSIAPTPQPRRALALAVATMTLLAPALASAAPIALVAGYPQRSHASRAVRSDDPLASDAGIAAADCDSDETWSWAFSLPDGVALASLEVWASGDATSCASPSARAPSATASCFRVASFPAASVASDNVVQFHSSDVVRAAFAHESAGAPGAVTPNDVLCHPSVDMQPTRVFLHFLAVDAGGYALGGEAPNAYESTFDTTYDLRGPSWTGPAPTVSAGPLYVYLQWDAPAQPAPDFASYRVYCRPRFGAADGGLPTFANGAPSPELEADACASSSANAAEIGSLQPGVGYDVAVAAIDRYGNAGPLSPVVGTSITGPRDEVPTSSGGGCGVASSRSGSLFAAIATIALALAARRRRA
jgi:hypothetical protein